MIQDSGMRKNNIQPKSEEMKIANTVFDNPIPVLEVITGTKCLYPVKPFWEKVSNILLAPKLMIILIMALNRIFMSFNSLALTMFRVMWL